MTSPLFHILPTLMIYYSLFHVLFPSYLTYLRNMWINDLFLSFLFYFKYPNFANLGTCLESVTNLLKSICVLTVQKLIN